MEKCMCAVWKCVIVLCIPFRIERINSQLFQCQKLLRENEMFIFEKFIEKCMLHLNRRYMEEKCCIWFIYKRIYFIFSCQSSVSLYGMDTGARNTNVGEGINGLVLI